LTITHGTLGDLSSAGSRIDFVLPLLALFKAFRGQREIEYLKTRVRALEDAGFRARSRERLRTNLQFCLPFPFRHQPRRPRKSSSVSEYDTSTVAEELLRVERNPIALGAEEELKVIASRRP